MARIAYLNHWSGDGPAALVAGPRPLAESLPLYALGDTDLRPYRALLVPAHADQRYLLGQRLRLEAFVQAGGTLVLNGHVAYPFLSWLHAFTPVAQPGLEGLRIRRAAEHPIFEGVDADDLTFRRGVAGFYARGANPAPTGAVVLNTVGQQALPVDWTLAVGSGRLLMHGGNDLWMYAGDTTSAARIVPQLMHWLQGSTT